MIDENIFEPDDYFVLKDCDNEIIIMGIMGSNYDRYDDEDFIAKVAFRPEQTKLNSFDINRKVVPDGGDTITLATEAQKFFIDTKLKELNYNEFI